MIDNYTLFLIKNDGIKRRITHICSDLKWRDSVDQLSMQLDVNISRNLNDIHMKNFDVVEVGDKLVLLNNNKEIFRGIIVDLNTARYNRSITAFDYAFYLNQSKTIIQFNKIQASQAIKQLCDKFNVQVGHITNISTQITKIYNNKTIADIIRDILKQAENELGTKYRLEMRASKLYIEKYKDLVVTPRFQPADNLDYIDVMKAINDISKTESIKNMRNSILISSSNEKSSRVIAIAKDDKNIAKFGLLQDVESVDDKNIAQATNIAKNKLKELNKVNEDISITVLGDDDVRAGRVLEIDNNMFDLHGQYLIKECEHNYHNRIHTMNLTIEKVV